MTPAELAAANTAMVYRLARTMKGLLGGDLDELVGDGMVGLVQAAQRFDSAKFDGPFSRYAKKRVKGAMIDGFRVRHRTGRDETAVVLLPLLAEDWENWDERKNAPSFYPWMPAAEDVMFERLALCELITKVGSLPPPLRRVVEAMWEDRRRVGCGGKGDGRMMRLADREGLSPSRMSQRLAEVRRRLAA